MSQFNLGKRIYVPIPTGKPSYPINGPVLKVRDIIKMIEEAKKAK